MKHWTRKRKVSLVIHGMFVSIPFALSTISAILFWHVMFDSWLLAASMVSVLDVLALTGLVLYIARIPSPFVTMRHLLPIISIVPLGRELYLLLAHNDAWLAWSLTLLTTAILVVVAWQCFRTIEALWIDPVTAAREQAREQIAILDTKLAQLTVLSDAADNFAWRRLSAVTQALAADDDPDITTVTIVSTADETVVTADRPVLSSAQARAIAARLGVSERTVRRHVSAGKLSAADIDGDRGVSNACEDSS